jgi:hypothetical protein
MCCGSRRSAWRSASPAPVAAARRPASSAIAPASSRAASQTPTTTRGPFPSVVLDYLEDLAIHVRGPVTGQRYDFSPAQPSQAVDARDAVVLTRSSAFRSVAS